MPSDTVVDTLSALVKVRGLACELRNLLEESIEALNASGQCDDEDTPGFEFAAATEDALRNAESIEDALDMLLPIETFPTPEPSSWKKVNPFDA